ncbi:hypothetical protein Tco_1283569 [Tanacetum coccineum]
MSVKYPTYVNLTSSSEEQPNERTPSPPPRKKSLSPPQAPSKSISSKSTHYTSSSSPSESLTPTHVAPPPKLRFVILIKQESQELPPLKMSPNNPYVSTMDNWPPGPSNPSPPSRVSRPPPGFPNPPPGFEPLPLTQLLFAIDSAKVVGKSEIANMAMPLFLVGKIVERRGEVSAQDELNEISHSYQKLKSFYKEVLDLGPEYIRDAKVEEWLTRGHMSIPKGGIRS